MDYFRAKAEQERLVAAGPVPWSMVRATQFHEFVASLLASGALRYVLPVPGALVQPVAAAEVARVVAAVAEGSPRRGPISIAGPDVVSARELVRAWGEATGRKVLPVPVPVPVPGALGRALRTGALTHDAPDVVGTTGFAAWLRGQGLERSAGGRRSGPSSQGRPGGRAAAGAAAAVAGTTAGGTSSREGA